MAASGFFEQKPASPLSFGAVLLLHGAAIGALLVIKGPDWIEPAPPLIITEVPLDPPPPPQPLPDPDQPRPPVASLSRLDVPPRIIATPAPSIPSQPASVIPGPLIGADPGPSSGIGAPDLPQTAPIERPAPVRVEAQFDPRFAGAMQPPYPVAEERAEREGAVRIRVTIGPDGRVAAAERLDATTDAFWRSTERQALSRWRFRPATVDGRPVQSSKVLNVRFRLDGR